jgi:hypothetical protein
MVQVNSLSPASNSSSVIFGSAQKLILTRRRGIDDQSGAGPLQGYLNFKGYGEFAAQNRAAGWNAWVTLAFSPKAEPPPMMKRPMLTK